MEKQLTVGYGREVITPDESIPLSGYSNEPKRFHTRVTEDICATAIAITDADGTTILMMTLDFGTASEYVLQPVRERISAQLGIPQDRIYMHVTHTHSAPDFSQKDLPCIQRYSEKAREKMFLAAKTAVEDRKPAQMLVGSLETKNMNFIKHYKTKDLKTGAIGYIGDRFGTADGKRILSHATAVDPTMHILQFKRQGGKDVVIVNFRAHPHFTGGYEKYDLSADYIGPFRMALEAMANCHAAYFQGASGNVDASTRLSAERRFSTCRSYGTALAAFALEGLQSHMDPTPAGKIKTVQRSMYGDLYRAPEHMLEPARLVLETWLKNYDQQECVALGEPYGIRSPYQATAILDNQKRTQEDAKIEINAVCIGEKFAFVTFPGEMFDSISVRMEENSPFDTTMMLGYSQHNVNYLPSRVAYRYTSYETDVTRFACGTGEKVADFQVVLLEELKG